MRRELAEAGSYVHRKNMEHFELPSGDIDIMRNWRIKANKESETAEGRQCSIRFAFRCIARSPWMYPYSTSLEYFTPYAEQTKHPAKARKDDSFGNDPVFTKRLNSDTTKGEQYFWKSL